MTIVRGISIGDRVILIMGSWNMNRRPWNVNREQWNVIMGTRNVIMGLWNVNRGPGM